MKIYNINEYQLTVIGRIGIPIDLSFSLCDDSVADERGEPWGGVVRGGSHGDPAFGGRPDERDGGGRRSADNGGDVWGGEARAGVGCWCWRGRAPSSHQSNLLICKRKFKKKCSWDHGSVTSRPFRKLWKTDRPTSQLTERSTTVMRGFKEVTLPIRNTLSNLKQGNCFRFIVWLKAKKVSRVMVIDIETLLW